MLSLIKSSFNPFNSPPLKVAEIETDPVKNKFFHAKALQKRVYLDGNTTGIRPHFQTLEWQIKLSKRERVNFLLTGLANQGRCDL